MSRYKFRTLDDVLAKGCGMWHSFKDTVFVQNDYQVLIRTKYDRYIGEFVIHCHILDHEERDMMTNIQIVPDLGAVGNGVGMSGLKHTAHNQNREESMRNPFAGTWTYRSFLNNPAPIGDDPSKLQAFSFAEAVWTIKDSGAPVFDGELSLGRVINRKLTL